MIGRNGIAKHGKYSGGLNVFQWRRLARHVLKVRRPLHVCGSLVPLKDLARRSFHALPSLVACERFCVSFFEHLGTDGGVDSVHYFSLRRPYIAKINRLAMFVVAERFRIDVDIHSPRQSVRDNQRGRRKIVGANERIDSAFEVAVSA